MNLLNSSTVARLGPNINNMRPRKLLSRRLQAYYQTLNRALSNTVHSQHDPIHFQHASLGMAPESSSTLRGPDLDGIYDPRRRELLEWFIDGQPSIRQHRRHPIAENKPQIGWWIIRQLDISLWPFYHLSPKKPMFNAILFDGRICRTYPVTLTPSESPLRE